MWLNPNTAQRDKSSLPTYRPDIYEENSDHVIRRDSSTIDQILEQLKKTPVLCDLIDLDIDQGCLRIGAGGGFHFASTHPIKGTPVLLKIGSGLGERYWMEQISRTAPDIVPTVYATGSRLGKLEVGWILLERIEAYDLGAGWQGNEFEMLLEAAARFQAAAHRIPNRHTIQADLQWLRACVDQGIQWGAPGPTNIIVDRMERDFAWVCSVCPPGVCHGDIHLGNGLPLGPPPKRCQLLLVDARPHWIPWAFEAAYLQSLVAGGKKYQGDTGLVAKLSNYRTHLGLTSCPGNELKRLETILMGWHMTWVWDPEDAEEEPDLAVVVENYVVASAELSE